MNRINRLFRENSQSILSIYFTAGHPALDSTVPIIKALVQGGADTIEIGMPFSDPMADGPVIQSSSSRALKNGMSLKLLFDQLKNVRKEVDIPLLLMGYLNPVLQYGMERFCDKCAETGIDGAILPDLPLQVYKEEYEAVFDRSGLYNVFLVSPQTSSERIRTLDAVSRGFIYMVSSSSTTGVKGSFSPEQLEYFERIRAMGLRNPALIGFGISDRKSFAEACRYARGAIIGSAFVKMLEEKGFTEAVVREFIRSIRE
jgi:tryptophan synthase alpha chain